MDFVNCKNHLTMLKQIKYPKNLMSIIIVFTAKTKLPRITILF